MTVLERDTRERETQTERETESEHGQGGRNVLWSILDTRYLLGLNHR